MSILITADELEARRFMPVETLITDHPAHKYWYQKIRHNYELMLSAYPNFYYRDYQPQTAATLLVRKRHIVAFAMGLGKTLISLLAIQALYAGGYSRKGQVHICAPDYLALSRWQQELERLKMPYQVVKTEKDLQTNLQPIILYTHEFPRHRSKQLAKSSRPHLSRVLRNQYRPALMVVDEAHHLGDKTTLRYQHLNYLLRSTRRAIALTGTLSDCHPNRVQDLCSLIYGSSWPYSSQAFQREFIGTKALNLGYVETARTKFLSRIHPEKAPDYYDLMRRYVFRVSLEEVKSTIKLPTAQVEEIILEPCSAHYALYEQYLINNKRTFKTASESCTELNALNLLHPLITLANSPPLTSQKIKAVLDRLKGYKSVIFYNYNSSKDYLISHLTLAGYTNSDYALITGDLKDIERIKELERFQNDSRVTVGIFSLRLASESIDITEANQIIYYCCGWSGVKIEQSICRAVRPGNPHASIKIVYLAQKGFIDAYQTHLIPAKRKLANQLLDYSFEEELETVTEADIKVSSVLKTITELAPF